MTDIEQKFSGAQQSDFMGKVGSDMGTVITDPKGMIWDGQDGDEEKKSELARRTVGAVAGQISLAMLFSVMGKNNKGVNGWLMHPYVFIGSLVAIGCCGFALLLHKHWRSQTAVAWTLFSLFTAGIAFALGGFMASTTYSHFWMVLLLSVTIGVDCLWFGLYRNKKAETIQRAMVVGTVLALVFVTILVVSVE